MPLTVPAGEEDANLDCLTDPMGPAPNAPPELANIATAGKEEREFVNGKIFLFARSLHFCVNGATHAVDKDN